MQPDATTIARQLRRRSRALRLVDRVIHDLLGDELPTVSRAFEQSDFVPGASEWCRRCGMSVGVGEATDDGCGSCRGLRPGFHAVVRLGPFEGDLRRWILMLKYLRWESMGMRLGRLLAEQLHQEEDRLSLVFSGNPLIVPMPMPWLRRLDRGVDHAAILARGVARELGLPMRQVLRRRAGPLQVGRSHEARRRLGGRGIRVRARRAGMLRGRPVILVDDVLTTGSTLRRAGHHLRRAGARCVVAAVVATAPEPGRKREAQGLRDDGR